MSFEKKVFYSLWALMPVIYIPDFGYGYREPKIMALFLLGAVCGLRLASRTVQAPRGLLAALGLLAVQALSYHPAVNLGLYWQSLGLTLSGVMIFLFVWQEDVDLRAMALLAVPSVLVVLVGSVAAILFKVALVSQYAEFGSTIGLKNSVSVWLALMIPFLLILVDGSRRQDRPSGDMIRAALFILMSVMAWVILSYRTRSAWWMLIVCVVSLACLAGRQGRRGRWARLLVFCVGAILVGVVCVKIIPGKMVWRSATPYADSLTSLASLRYSSGRDHLWKVGLSMISRNPLRGVGGGNYAVFFRRYIPSSGADPMRFAFMQRDLPIFNDYLQQAVETGILGGIAFMTVAFLLPCAAWIKMSRSRETDPAVLLCGLACLAIAVDGLFDYPFLRPETLLPFCAGLGFVARRLAVRTVRLPRFLFPPLTVSLICLCVAFFSFGFRSEMPSPRWTTFLQDTAYRLWPWDSFWDEERLDSLLRRGDMEGAAAFVSQRRRFWPFDPDSFLLEASLQERQGRFGPAVDAYRHAVLEVPGGRCHASGYAQYRRFAASLPRSAQASKLSGEELGSCIVATNLPTWR